MASIRKKKFICRVNYGDNETAHPIASGHQKDGTDRRQRSYIINCRKAPLKSTAFSSTISAQ